MSIDQSAVDIRPWASGDLPLLEQTLGDPAMMAHLGGPETPEQIRRRHARFCQAGMPGDGGMFAIVLGPERLPVGSTGYWPREWQGQTVWETGWQVLPAYQGRGIATRAIALVAARARAERRHGWLHAFPSVENGPSNAVCRKAGFTLLGPFDFEYPPGHPMRCNDWALELFGE